MSIRGLRERRQELVRAARDIISACPSGPLSDADRALLISLYREIEVLDDLVNNPSERS